MRWGIPEALLSEGSHLTRPPLRGVHPLPPMAEREISYAVVDFGVGTMRVMTIFSRSRQSGTRGAILVFQ